MLVTKKDTKQLHSFRLNQLWHRCYHSFPSFAVNLVDALKSCLINILCRAPGNGIHSKKIVFIVNRIIFHIFHLRLLRDGMKKKSKLGWWAYIKHLMWRTEKTVWHKKCAIKYAHVSFKRHFERIRAYIIKRLCFVSAFWQWDFVFCWHWMPMYVCSG